MAYPMFCPHLLERLPGANGRKDPLRSLIYKRQKRSSKTKDGNAQETSTLCHAISTDFVLPKEEHNHGQMAFLNRKTWRDHSRNHP